VEEHVKDCFFKPSLTAETGDRNNKSHNYTPCVNSHYAMKNTPEKTSILLRAMFIPHIYPTGLVGCGKDAMPFLRDGFGKLSAQVEHGSAKFGVV
jgi:hypothetical protein